MLGNGDINGKEYRVGIEQACNRARSIVGAVFLGTQQTAGSEARDNNETLSQVKTRRIMCWNEGEIGEDGPGGDDNEGASTRQPAALEISRLLW